MKKIYYISFLILALAGLWAGFYFRGSFSSFYNDVGKGVENLQKTDLGNIVSEATKQLLNPPPLTFNGKENSALLVKSKIIAQTNIQRYDNGGLPPLLENAKLNAAAKAKAEDIFKNQYFEHVSPQGVDPGQLVKSAGYDYIVSGENLILGNFADERELVQAWMDSPGHRANILNDRFVDIGVAIIKGTYEGKTVWVGVQEFGLDISACPSPNPALKGQIDANKKQLDALAVQIEAKKKEIDSTNPHNPNYNAMVDQYNKMVAEYNSLASTTKTIISQYNREVNEFNQCVAGNKL